MATVSSQPGLGPPGDPLCTVCIAHYMGPALLGECLDSVLSQVCDFPVEIIVHDDASPDDSLPYLAQHYPQISVIRSAENVGFCVANNRMVTSAHGQFVLLLNNDATLRPGALAALARVAGASPNAVLTLPQFDQASGALVDRGCRLDPFYNPVPIIDNAGAPAAMTIGACLWIARAQWHSLGGFPPWMGSLGEDLFLCCAARLTGSAVMAVPESGYDHRQGHSFGGNKPSEGRLVSTTRRRRQSEQNKTFTMIVMTPTPMVWPLLAVHLLALLFEGLLLSIARRSPRLLGDIYLQVFAALYRERSRLLALRRSVQQRRAVPAAQYLAAFTPVPRKLMLLWHFGWPRFSDNSRP